MMTAMWNYQLGAYQPYTNKVSKYWLLSDESPAITERLEQVVAQVEHALPGVFALTNQLANVLSNSATLTSSLSDIAIAARPAVSNLAAATANLSQRERTEGPAEGLPHDRPGEAQSHHLCRQPAGSERALVLLDRRGAERVGAARQVRLPGRSRRLRIGHAAASGPHRA